LFVVHRNRRSQPRHLVDRLIYTYRLSDSLSPISGVERAHSLRVCRSAPLPAVTARRSEFSAATRSVERRASAPLPLRAAFCALGSRSIASSKNPARSSTVPRTISSCALRKSPSNLFHDTRLSTFSNADSTALRVVAISASEGSLLLRFGPEILRSAAALVSRSRDAKQTVKASRSARAVFGIERPGTFRRATVSPARLSFRT
jgi:hypothetical protein